MSSHPSPDAFLAIRVASLWPRFSRLFRRGYQAAVKSLSDSEAKRIQHSSIRVASFSYALSRSLDTRFDEHVAVAAGVCAATFDDLIDEAGYAATDMRVLLLGQPRRGCQRAQIFLLSFTQLLSRIERWQHIQLRQDLERLIDAEFNHNDKRDNWAERGTASLCVILTLTGFRHREADAHDLLCLGRYLQALDDYEDVVTDCPEKNWFTSHARSDIERLYCEDARPALISIFSTAPRPDLLLRFIDTYHCYTVELFRNRHVFEPVARHPVRAVTRVILRKIGQAVPFDPDICSPTKWHSRKETVR